MKVRFWKGVRDSGSVTLMRLSIEPALCVPMLVLSSSFRTVSISLVCYLREGKESFERVCSNSLMRNSQSALSIKHRTHRSLLRINLIQKNQLPIIRRPKRRHRPRRLGQPLVGAIQQRVIVVELQPRRTACTPICGAHFDEGAIRGRLGGSVAAGAGRCGLGEGEVESRHVARVGGCVEEGCGGLESEGREGEEAPREEGTLHLRGGPWGWVNLSDQGL